MHGRLRVFACMGACVFLRARPLFLSLLMTVFTPNPAQFATIVSICSHLLKSEVLKGEAFCFTFQVLCWSRGGWPGKEAELAELGAVGTPKPRVRKVNSLISEADSWEVGRENLLVYSVFFFFKAIA